MKKKLFLFVLALATVQVTLAQAQWKADPVHTNVRFDIEHLGISFIDGEFTQVEGLVESPSATRFDGATFNFTIQVASVDTRVEARNKHLLSADFFDAKKYPTITLKNAVLKHDEGNEYTLTGDLTLHGVTKTVTFDVEQNGKIITDPWGKKRAGFTAELTIDRTDYGINFGAMSKNGAALAVGKEVEITVNTELVLQK